MNKHTIVEGVIGGTIGAVAVAGWFLCIDVSMGQPFRTPALLGATVFEGLRDPTALHTTARLVLEYTVLHWVAFVAFGLAQLPRFLERSVASSGSYVTVE